MPKVSILLASYGPQSQRYLDLCFRSLEAQTFQDFEVIHVSSGEFQPQQWKDGLCCKAGKINCNHFHYAERQHYPSAVTKALEQSDKTSEYLLLLNDDTILDKNCLLNMYETHRQVPDEIILNALCNSDAFGFLYYVNTGIVCENSKHRWTKPQYTYEEIEPFLPYMHDQWTYPFALVNVPFNPFYCTMMKRSTYDKVGGIDTRYLTGKDDADFMMRAAKMGVKSMAALHACVFHFGGATSNITATDEERRFNADLFEKIHGIRINP